MSARLSGLSRPPAGFLRPRLPPVGRSLLANAPSGTGGSVPTPPPPPPYAAAVSMGNTERGGWGLHPSAARHPCGLSRRQTSFRFVRWSPGF